MEIPFVDLRSQYLSIKSEIDDAIQQVIDQTAFIKGKFVDEFEAQFARAYGVKYCIGVANGTDAIFIVLKCLGIGPGDEVITVANSWISTSEAVSQTGATPVFVDIEPDYFTIDPALIEEKITPRTRAVLPVHLYGQAAQIDVIRALCEKRRLYLVEDCAQAHFASLEGKRVGTFGITGTFSFYPGKNLGAYGDAGAIITDSDDLAEKVRMFANHGQRKKHEHLMEGVNSRLDGLQAAILSAKLRHIGEWTERRQSNALQYDRELHRVKTVVSPGVRNSATHVYHLYVIRHRQRDALQKFLLSRGIHTAVHYPTPLPLLPAYQHLAYSASQIPVATEWQRQILSLPMYPELTTEQISYVAASIEEFDNHQ